MTTTTASLEAFAALIARRATRNSDVIAAVESNDIEALRALIPGLMREEIAAENEACERVANKTERGEREVSAVAGAAWREIRVKAAMTSRSLFAD